MTTAMPILVAIVAVTLISAPEEVIPTKEGMSWRYNMTEESGPGVRLSDDEAHEAGTLHADVIYRIQGTKDVDGRKLLAFEMHREGRLTNTDLVTADEHGVLCWARVDETGELT